MPFCGRRLEQRRTGQAVSFGLSKATTFCAVLTPTASSTAWLETGLAASAAMGTGLQ